MQAKGSVTVIGEKPVVAGLHMECDRHVDGFVPHPIDLKIGFVLPLQLDFFVVQPPREVHGAVGGHQKVSGKFRRLLDRVGQCVHEASPENEDVRIVCAIDLGPSADMIQSKAPGARSIAITVVRPWRFQHCKAGHCGLDSIIKSNADKVNW